MPMFSPATKKQLKARIALEGPAGSGKTYTALRFAFALAGQGGRVAVIDTEHRSASKYSGESPDGVPFAFDVCELEHFSADAYTAAVNEAGRAGFDVLVIDSLSHAWEGVGGALDMVDRKAANTPGGSYAAWRDVTPLHRKMVEAILACPAHVIATMRTKTAYAMEEIEKNGRAKTAVTKLGMKPIQREGVDYEFDVIGDIDIDHILTISKTRCPALDGIKAVKPAGNLLAPLIEWLSDGIKPPNPVEPDAPEPAASPASESGSAGGGVKLSGKVAVDPYSKNVDDPCGETVAGQIIDAAKTLETPIETVKQWAAGCGVTRVAEIPGRKAEELLALLNKRVAEKDCPFPA